MISETLELEFDYWSKIHKRSIVLGALLNFYRDLAATNTEIVDPLEAAQQHLQELLQKPSAFEYLYEKAWDVYKTLVD